MQVENRWRTVAILGVLMLMGCAKARTSILRDEKPSPEDAYVYGRFSMMASDNLKGSSYALHFACEHGETFDPDIDPIDAAKIHIIGFSEDEPVQVVRIPGGGRCTLVASSIYTSSADHYLLPGMPREAMAVFHLDAGKAYYLGDLLAVASPPTHRVERILNSSMVSEILSCAVTDRADHFVKTTAEMRALFPLMASLPVEDSFPVWNHPSELLEVSLNTSHCTDTPEFHKASAVEKKRMLRECRKQQRGRVDEPSVNRHQPQPPRIGHMGFSK